MAKVIHVRIPDDMDIDNMGEEIDIKIKKDKGLFCVVKKQEEMKENPKDKPDLTEEIKQDFKEHRELSEKIRAAKSDGAAE